MDERKIPKLAVDVIINYQGRIVLIERKNPPYGWALPGGYVEYGETVEEAAQREVKEETGLSLNSLKQFHVYSDPMRDPRGHTVSVVFVANAEGEFLAGDDAKAIGLFELNNLPLNLAFDHRKIIEDYKKSLGLT
ncbi:MAG: NUDIX hydrolase [candidate division WOR-3 bacterium]|nr:NUDIX hydrolase [candidate division WOR-3 bacterium]